ncbi:MAG: hypothetical protein ABS62_08845 [Microbacterium sp. SCN 70-200]|uniref:hypothetical protein n=1 Tax=Microbacterium sp. TaxID=51671 RepID=UPI00086F9519|nr:hypothetical protein [Microbacterium sp.]MBN9213268.1 hypothetical protein [Microbacterium sp.]ODT40668.1 MAG: hypothetical protein ABS62_08845 [Microbacterium sp. SCN 70-200]OJV83665.1 MAG: hypothetical protein BGO46_11590 [Microbacterium sp. 70-16]
MTNSLLTAAPCPVTLIRRGDAPHSDRAVRAGELTIVARGVYAATTQWRSLAPWQRYVARVHATALLYPGAIFCGESAAALRGHPVFLEPREVHIVARPGAVTARAVAGVRFHTRERMPEHTELAGMAVVTGPELAVDIARVRHNAIGLAVAGAVLSSDPTISRDILAAVNEGRSSSRGRRHARWVIDRASAVPESTLEHVSLAVIEWLGFPEPELQQWVRGADGDGDRLDFLWPTWAIAGEADGGIKYSGELGDARDALHQRNVRDARLLSRGIRATAHWEWADVALSAQLKAKLLAVGLPLVRPEDTRQLRTLTAALGYRAPNYR